MITRYDDDEVYENEISTYNRRVSDEDKDEDDIEIDTCLCCGKTFGWTEDLNERWRLLHQPRQGILQAQRCWRCLAL